MKSLKHTLQESLRIGINDNPYTASPESWDELRQIIEERYKEQGPGTENEPINFNDIDVSGMTAFYSGGYDGVGLFEKTNFEYIDISDWDVSKVENMKSMFLHCFKIKYLGDLSNWHIDNCKNMRGMFQYCKQLENIGDISNWNTSNIEDMSFMFSSSNITNTPDWYKK